MKLPNGDQLEPVRRGPSLTTGLTSIATHAGLLPGTRPRKKPTATDARRQLGPLSNTVGGNPVRVEIPASASGSAAYVLDMRQLVLIDRSQIEVFEDPYSPSANDQRVLRVTARLGLGLPYGKAVTKITGLSQDAYGSGSPAP